MKDPLMASGRFQFGTTLNKVVAVWEPAWGGLGRPGCGLSHWLICCSVGFLNMKEKQNSLFSAISRQRHNRCALGWLSPGILVTL